VNNRRHDNVRDFQFVVFMGSSEELHAPRLDCCIVCDFRRGFQFVVFMGSSEELHAPRLDCCIVCDFRTFPVITDCHLPFGCTTSGSKLRQQQRHRQIPQRDCLQTLPTVIDTFYKQLTWLIKLFIRDTNKCPFDTQIQYRFYMFPRFMPPEISISVPTGVDYCTIFKLPDNILHGSVHFRLEISGP